MPQDPYRTINGPDGPLHFPSNMSDEEITQVMKTHYPAPTPAPQKGSQFDPTTRENRIGALVPEAAVPALNWFQQHANEPLDAMAARSVRFGQNVGAEAITGYEMLSHPSRWLGGPAYGPMPPAASTPEQKAAQDYPRATGVAKGVGAVAGGAVGDPRNWPFFASGAARPLLQRAISGGFATSMGKDAVNAARDLYTNWDKYTPEQRAQLATQGGLGAVMATATGLHATLGGDTHLAKPTETSVSPQVGREAASGETTRPYAESVPAPQTTTGRGEPVHAAEGSEIAEQAPRTPFLAEIKEELTKRTREEGSKVTEGGKVGVGAAKVDPNWMDLAQKELRANLDREPTISETLQHAATLKAQAMGIEDPVAEARIGALERKGVARDVAERQVKERMGAEKRQAEIIAQQKARPGEAGILSFRKTPPIMGPLGPTPTWRLGDFLDKLSNVPQNLMERGAGLAERASEETKARDVTREFASKLALNHLRLEAALKDAINAHENDGEVELRAFMDAGEGKTAAGPVNWGSVGPNSPHPTALHLSVKDVATAQELHNMFQDRWTKIQDLLDKEPGGIDNYLSHLWERPGMAKQTMRQFFGKRPIAGQARFLKQRFYEYASDAMDHGQKPITYNPIRMQLTALFQMDKFIAAHDLKDVYKQSGLVQWVKHGDSVPEGWQPLNDKIFSPQIMQEGLLGGYGRYLAPPDVARIFNRYVSPGLRGNAAYDNVRQYGNMLNQLNLGASGYHGMFITGVSGASDVALGLEKLINNRDIGGFKNIFRGTLGTFIASSARRDYDFGKKLQAEAINPTGNTKLQAYVDDLVKAGARFNQDPMYSTTSEKRFLASAMSGRFIDAAKAGARDFPVTKFIMEKYVPRVKLGMAAHMMETKMQYLLDRGISDPDTVHNELGKIWDSVDNRAGQMVYDNLFWNKVAKDISFLGVRAVGWDYGSYREGLGAVKDTLQQTGKALKGERPELTHRQAFVAGTAMTMATIGAVTTYLATGKAPQTAEDYFYPYSGRIGTNGKPERMSYASYAKEYFAAKHALRAAESGNLEPGADIFLHKAHPMLDQVFRIISNKDFYNTEIRSEGDPMYQQGWQTLKFGLKSFAPFVATLGQQRAKTTMPTNTWIEQKIANAVPESIKTPFSQAKASPIGQKLDRITTQAGPYAEAFAGLQSAPSYITNSPAEELALDFAKRNWKAGPLTTREREQRDTFNQFQVQVAQGNLDTRAVSNAIQTGKMRVQDLDRLFEDTGMTRFQAEFKSLKLPEALKVMQAANAQERQSLKLLLIDKVDQLEDFPDPSERNHYQELMQKYLQ